MKNIFLVLFMSVFGGCAFQSQYHTEPIKAPSVGAVKSKIEDAKNAVNRANKNVIIVSDKIKTSRSLAKRIDDKAVIILENWK